MKRILITGITGFVGSNLVQYFNGAEDIQIFGYSRNSESIKSSFNYIEFIPELTARIFDRYFFDTIIHLAGIAHDLSGNYKKEDYYKVNYEWTTKIYDEFLKSKTNNFVFVSSIKAVVDHADEMIDERYKPIPTSDYGVSKLMAEEYILSHQKSNKYSYILRPCMIHGPGNKGNLNLLYKFVKLGMPYPLAAFDNKRSFLSIDNFCFTINEILNERLKGGDYLLADNEAISTKDLISLIAEIRNQKIRFLRIPKGIVLGFAKAGSLLKAPFNSKTLIKLVENMEVSNKKLLVNLGRGLPVSTIDGLTKTIKSFNE